MILCFSALEWRVEVVVLNVDELKIQYLTC